MIDTNSLWPGWETVKPIGKGGFGTVYEIRRSIFDETEKAALKVISIPQSDSEIAELRADGYDRQSIAATYAQHLKNLVNEYSIMRKMSGCPNIVSCDDVRYTQHEDGIGWDIFIKMELLTPMIDAFPRTVSQQVLLKCARDLCNALVVCKRYNVIHRDIKPQNIFVSPEGYFKLGDFGIAKAVEKTMGGTKIGTYKYMAPEVYNNQPYGSSADIYSLGLVLYWMLNEHRMPFLPTPPAVPTFGDEEQAKLRRFRGEPLPPPKNGSDALKAIVLKACAYNPADRFESADQMLAALEAVPVVTPVQPAPIPAPMPPPAPRDNEATQYLWPTQELPPVNPAPEPIKPKEPAVYTWHAQPEPKEPEPAVYTWHTQPEPATVPKHTQPEPDAPRLGESFKIPRALLSLYLLLFSLFFLRLRTMFYGYYFFDFMSFHRPSGGLIYILFGHLIFALPAMAVGLYSHDRLQVRLSVSLVLSFAVFLALSLSYFVYWGFYHYLITLLISLATAFYFHERFQLRVLFSIGVAVASFFLLCTYRLASIISIFLLLSYFATMFFYGRFPLSLSISIVIAIAPYLLLLLFLNTLPEYLYPTCIIPLSLCSAVYLKDRFHWHHKAATAVTVVMAFLIYVFVLFPGLFF